LKGKAEDKGQNAEERQKPEPASGAQHPASGNIRRKINENHEAVR
jgi:hypothetical protein